jgi:dTDP-4-amino-4,6-dideoxygalactose transaminase
MGTDSIFRYSIPFNKQFLTGKELEYVRQAIEFAHTSGGGPFTERCEQFLERTLGARKALLTTSCTHALEMTALLLNIQPGDEVIVPSFTFVSTANAFALRGARLVFCDIRLDTLNLDEKRLEPLITPRTKAVIPVHYSGVGCEMASIVEQARVHGFTVVEDNAHGLLGTYKGRQLGTFGSLATLSFHETKNFSCGEGGALLINDEQYSERAEILREKGTDRNRFLRGAVDKYSWVDLGSSYIPSDILAAVLYAQLEARDLIQEKRQAIWDRYHDAFAGWAEERSIRRPSVPPQCQHPYHMYYLILPSLVARQALIDHLKRRGILAVFHYTPLHLSSMGRRACGAPGDCPVTEYVADRLLRLPFYSGLTTSEQEQVIEAVKTGFQSISISRRAGEPG